MGVVEIEARQIPVQTTPGGLWNEAFYRLVRNPGAIVGAVIVTAFVVVALFAPLLAPYSPTAVNLDLVADGCCPGPPKWKFGRGSDRGPFPLNRSRPSTHSRHLSSSLVTA